MNRLMFAAVCAAVAATVAGCRYGKQAGGVGDDASAADEASLLATGENTDDETVGLDDTDADTSDEMSLEGATDSTRPFSEYLSPVAGAQFAPVYFGYDSSAFPASEASKIEAVARDLQENAKHVVVIEGNCDERGANEYNLVLGQNRAIAVRDYMVRLGVSADRIQATSFGEEKPVDPGHNEAAWTKNRRGDFSLYTR